MIDGAIGSYLTISLTVTQQAVPSEFTKKRNLFENHFLFSLLNAPGALDDGLLTFDHSPLLEVRGAYQGNSAHIAP